MALLGPLSLARMLQTATNKKKLSAVLLTYQSDVLVVLCVLCLCVCTCCHLFRFSEDSNLLIAARALAVVVAHSKNDIAEEIGLLDIVFLRCCCHSYMKELQVPHAFHNVVLCAPTHRMLSRMHTHAH